MSKIILSLIAGNEGTKPGQEIPIIKRCIENIIHLVDVVVLSYNGTDDTVDIADAVCKKHKIPFIWEFKKWEAFDINRNHSLEMCMKYADEHRNDRFYIMFQDCDDLVYASDGKSLFPPLPKSKMVKDGYRVRSRFEDSESTFTWLIRADRKKPWKWDTAVHEVLIEDNASGGIEWKADWGDIKGGYLLRQSQGDRSKDPTRFLKDVYMLECARRTRYKYHPRTEYYLGQSYRSCNLFIQAEKQFIARGYMKVPSGKKDAKGEDIMIPYLDDYTYLARIYAAKIRIDRGKGLTLKTLKLLQDAHEIRPKRLESVYYLIDIWQKNKQYVVGWGLAKSFFEFIEVDDGKGGKIKQIIPEYKKPEGIFVDNDIHNFRFFDVAAICAYYANDRDSFFRLSKKILDARGLDEATRRRVSDNIRLGS